MNAKDAPATLTVTPIGVARTPFPDRASAPRQPAKALGVKGTIELFPDGRFEHALSDLESFPFVWVLFWFHLNEGWKAKVRPPRSAVRRGVFATRSPHRPNPIGMSVLRLLRVDGLTLHVENVDLVDRTPILDVKPYLAYTDSLPAAGHGWVESGPSPEAPGGAPGYRVEVEEPAASQLVFLSERGVDLWPRIVTVLETGPSPHPYRRIRKDGDGYRLAVQEWRARFRLVERVVTVERVASGYRPSQLFAGDPELALHREFAERFGV